MEVSRSLFVFLRICILGTTLSTFTQGYASQRTCQSLRSSICSQVGYNLTSFPNDLGHKNQRQAAVQMSTYYPLIHTECSPFLREFLCAAHYPQCSANQQEVVLPCRDLCLKAYSGCSPLLERFGYPWPSSLSCDRFPVSTKCWSGKKTETTTHPTFKTTRPEAEGVVRPTSTVVSESIVVAKNASRPSFPLGQGLPSGTQFVKPILRWLKSSAKLNYAQAKLAGEQANVAKLTSKKLSLEIARLKKEG